MPLNVKKTLLKAQSLARKGELAGAAALFGQVLEQFPGNKQAAASLAALKNNPQASPAPPREFQLAMQDVVRLFNAGHGERALEQALVLVRQYPAEPVLHNLIGAVCTERQQYEQAVASYREAIRLHPGYAEAYSNLGAALNQSADQGGAIDAYTRAIELDPAMHEAHNNLGNLYRECGMHTQALPCYKKAVALKPDFAAAHNNLGCALSDLGRYDEGAASCARALEFRPQFDKARGMLLHQLALMCDWDAMQPMRALIPELGIAGEPVIPFELLHLDDNAGRHLARSQAFAKKSFHEMPEYKFSPPKIRPKKLRIGYFSSDFGEHATMYLMIRMFELHDRERFEIHAFSNSPGDGGEMRQRLNECVDAFHDINNLGNREAAALAREQNIDIAVDLKGYTEHSRLGIFAYRPAPVSVTYIGYPGTTGAPFMDYLIGDSTVTPEEHDEHYTESIIRLPHSYQVNDNTRAIAEQMPARPDAGLPESGFVFCCFNNSNKISPVEFGIWMQLLEEIADSVLWLFRSNQWMESNLRREAEKHGIDPGRLVFAQRLPLPEHLARLKLADLFLDTFNYNAHTTASDALWAGLPVVTKIGNSFSARVGASLLHAVELPSLITESEGEYKRVALELARNPQQLVQLKRHLADKHDTAPLFDSEATTRAIESAYDEIFNDWRGRTI